jgi:hypothetical protein
MFGRRRLSASNWFYGPTGKRFSRNRLIGRSATGDPSDSHCVYISIFNPVKEDHPHARTEAFPAGPLLCRRGLLPCHNDQPGR